MPKNTVSNAAAAKAKKQKIILIIGGVLLLALGALQGPKLLKHGGGQAAPPAAAASDGSSAAAGEPVSSSPVAGTAAASMPTAVVSGKIVGTVGGVALTASASVKPATNQLASFTLFEVKDPFVPGVDSTAVTPEQAAPGNPNGEAPPAGSNGESAAGQGSSSSGQTGDAGAPVNPTPPPRIYATIDFNGNAQQLKVKDQFPADQPLFVLRSLQKKTAKIAVAGGAFDDSETFALKLNKKVTLVNTATGVRYELKLVYTGASPEVIEGFTTKAPADTSAPTTETTSTANAG